MNTAANIFVCTYRLATDAPTGRTHSNFVYGETEQQALAALGTYLIATTGKRLGKVEDIEGRPGFPVACLGSVIGYPLG